MTPSGGVTTLYSFCAHSNCPDGANPYAGLILAVMEITTGQPTRAGAAMRDSLRFAP